MVRALVGGDGPGSGSGSVRRIGMPIGRDPPFRKCGFDMNSHPVQRRGKFLFAGNERFHPKGVSYGTFAPDARGEQFPPLHQVVADFQAMRALRRQHGPHLHRARRVRSSTPRPTPGCGSWWASRGRSTSPSSTTPATARTVRRTVADSVAQLRDHPGGADGRARQRDSVGGRPLARAGAHRALPARAVRRRPRPRRPRRCSPT